MPPTAIISSRFSARTTGFTLVEILVVVVIIGLIMVGAILSLNAGGRDTQMAQERDRLGALISYVRERGSMLTLEYGIRLGQHGYRISVYDPRLMQWTEDSADDALRLRRLPAGLTLQLVIEGRPVVLDDKSLTVPPHSSSASSPTSIGAVGASTAPLGTLGSATNLSNLAQTAAAANASSSSSSSGSSSSSASSTPPSSSGIGAGSLGSTQGSSYTPQVMLFSNGDTNSFSLTLVREGSGRSATIQSNEDGPVIVGEIVEPQK